MKTTLHTAPLDWEIVCGSDRVYYKLQNDTKNTVIAHSYHKLRSTNCLLVHARAGPFSEYERSKFNEFSMVSVYFRMRKNV